MAKSMPNSPKVKLALVGVSRDCFPVELARKRLAALARACKAAGLGTWTCPTIIENESAAMTALEEARAAGANAAVIYLGNFGPEAPLTIFAQRFAGPVMLCAAAEETKADLVEGRGDALCGMLNASYNLGLRRVAAHIPPRPVGLPEELAKEIAHFQSVARVWLGVKALKVFSFGPRPQDFFACHAPLQGLYDLGVEVMENSELDLLQLFQAVDEKDSAVRKVARQMAAELGAGNTYPDILPQLARFEVAMTRFSEANLGSRQFAVFANKCWPAFEKYFGFVPCYVNSRLATAGVPAACEVDIYGAVSEYCCQLAADAPATLLDVNNSVPRDLVAEGADLAGAAPEDLFMGFHCGNTPGACLVECSMKFQLIMKRLMEDPGAPPKITRGTLEGRLRPGDATLFRVQSPPAGGLRAYAAQGAILDIDPHTFGGTGVIGVPNFARFYRHVLIGKRFPHHVAMTFSHCGRVLFDAASLLGVGEVSTPLPPSQPYPGENPFA